MDYLAFLNLIENKCYESAKVLLLNEISTQKSLDKNVLEKVNPTLLSFLTLSEKTELLAVFFKNNFYEKICELIQTEDFTKNSVDSYIYYLSSLKAVGQVALFQKKLKQYVENIISLKAYSAIEKLFKTFEEDLKRKDYYLVSKIIYLVEIENLNELARVLETVRARYLTLDLSFAHLRLIYDQVEISKKFNEKFFYEKIMIKALCALKGKIDLIEKEYLEILLMSKTKIDHIILAELMLLKQDNDSHVAYLQNDLNVSLIDFPPILKNAKIKKQFLSKVNLVSETHDDQKHENEKIDLSSSFKETDTSDISSSYIMEKDEQELLKYLKVAKDKKYFNENLLVTFLTMNYLSVAEYIVDNIKPSTNAFYLNSIIKMKKGDFSSAIDMSNEAIMIYKIHGEELIPFEVIKAVCFKRLGLESDYNRIKKEIMLLNPSVKITENMWRL